VTDTRFKLKGTCSSSQSQLLRQLHTHNNYSFTPAPVHLISYNPAQEQDPPPTRDHHRRPLVPPEAQTQAPQTSPPWKTPHRIWTRNLTPPFLVHFSSKICLKTVIRFLVQILVQILVIWLGDISRPCAAHTPHSHILSDFNSISLHKSDGIAPVSHLVQQSHNTSHIGPQPCYNHEHTCEPQCNSVWKNCFSRTGFLEHCKTNRIPLAISLAMFW
jgi:hypothetical protein